MAGRLSNGYQLLKKTGEEFSKDDCMSMAAGLAYYTIFSLPPLLVIILGVASMVVDPERVVEQMEEHMGEAVTEEGREQIHQMIEESQRGGRGIIASLVGLVVLIFGATGAMAQLQVALNRVWNVAPDPERGGLKQFVKKRMLSLGMVLAIAFLLLVSLVLTFVLRFITEHLAHWLRPELMQPLMWADFLIPLIIFTLLFAAMFKVMPDAEIAWRDVWVGAIVTALLFRLGMYLIGLYLGMADPGDAYGQAGALVLILVWIYYSSLILLFGAEFTQVWARRHGKRIRPSEGAVRRVRESRDVRENDEQPEQARPDTSANR